MSKIALPAESSSGISPHLPDGATRPRESYVWARHRDDWYVEPHWVSARLLEAEIFIGEVIDPCCGGGNIVESARARHLPAEGWDIVNRGFPGTVIRDWLEPTNLRPCNVVCNPPFNLAREFAELAVERARHKSAILFPVARMNAAWRWLQPLPLKTVYLLSPRPSMPPGGLIARGEKPGGGKTDFAWLLFDRDHVGAPNLRWLHRDRGPRQ
jgi:hypothetical protein